MSEPRITIGMVVRNGERHIAHAIESFQAQTRQDFALGVHDNASSDRTCAIVESFAQGDGRMRLHRHKRDIGVVANLIHAAEQARTEYFCWAACDDVREPMFLERLASVLDASPEVGLACSAVRNIDPDGTPRDIRPETSSLRTTTGMSRSHRLRMYLRGLSGTPFYGLFRTPALHSTLDTLRAARPKDDRGPPLLGLDMVFLARFVNEHGLAYVPEPLLRFRRGGMSHSIGRYGSLAAYLNQLRSFRAELRRASRMQDARFVDRMRNCMTREHSYLRWLLSREMRFMTAHYVAQAFPGARAIARRMCSPMDADLRRLRHRLGPLGSESRIVLFGAGKHTQRRLRDVQHAVRGLAMIVGVCDDHPTDCSPIDGLPVVASNVIASLRPDIVLVSSDAYEQALHARARTLVPRWVPVWCLYDVALESSVADAASSGEAASTIEMKVQTSSNASVSVPACRV